MRKVICIFILFIIIFNPIFGQENEDNTDLSDKDNIEKETTTKDSSDEETNLKLDKIRKSMDKTDVEDENQEDVTQGNGVVIIQTLFVCLVIFLIYLLIQFFLKKYRTNISNSNKIGKVILSEYIDKTHKIGVLEILESRYFLVSLSGSITVIYEFKDKEDIDKIKLIKSQENSLNNNFFELLGIKQKRSLNDNTNYKNNFINPLKKRVDSLKRGKNGES